MCRAVGVRWLLALLALVPLTGCHTYAVTSLDKLSPGLQARVRLDDDGFGRVLNQAVTNGVPIESMALDRKAVVGRVLQLEPDNLRVQLRGAGDAVYSASIPNHSIREVALRSFDLRRTIGAVAVGAVLFAAVYSGATGGTTADDLPPEPDLMVLRLFSIHVH